MKIKCPNCRHDFDVAVAVVDQKVDVRVQYRQSVDRLTRHEPRFIPRPPTDPDRPVSR